MSSTGRQVLRVHAAGFMVMHTADSVVIQAAELMIVLAAYMMAMLAGGDGGVAGNDPSAKDLQEGEAGESTPNLEGSSRVPAGHMDHGQPAEGLRIHTEPGSLEKVSGRGVGRGSNNAANSHQALNKKVGVWCQVLPMAECFVSSHALSTPMKASHT